MFLENVIARSSSRRSNLRDFFARTLVPLRGVTLIPRTFLDLLESAVRIIFKTFIIVLVSGFVGLSALRTPALAQANDPANLPEPLPKFENLSLENGLSQSVVMTIFQDPYGFIWFGTQDGLNRFDGHRFVIFRPSTENPLGLNDGWITAICADQQGILWVGTNNGGLNRFDPTSGIFSHFQHQPDNAQSPSANKITSLWLDPQSGQLWIGTANGLDRMDPRTEEFAHFQHDPENPDSLSNNYIRAMIAGPENTLWIGTNDGLNQFNPQTGRFTRWQHDPNQPNSPATAAINSLFQDHLGQLWVGTSAGLDRFDPATGEFVHYIHAANTTDSLSHSLVHTIFEDSQQNLWIGTHYGLNRFNPETGKFENYYIRTDNRQSQSASRILTIYEDREGSLWFGTFGNGVHKFDRAVLQFPHFSANDNHPNGLNESDVFQLAEDSNGLIWIATLGGGLNRFDPQNGEFKAFQQEKFNPKSISSDHVFAVTAAQNGIIWVGTEKGLDEYNPSTGIFRHFLHNPNNPQTLGGAPVFWILAGESGDLWIGHANGFDHFSTQTSVFTHFKNDPNNPNSFSGRQVSTMLQSPDGKLWIGSLSGGLNRFNPNSQTFEHFRHNPADANSLNSNMVLSIYQAESGALWVGTDKGLAYFDPQNQTFTRFTTANGLPNDVIYGIVADHSGFLWLSTNNGVSRFDPQTQTFTNYNQSDGLQSQEFNMNAHARTRSGLILFGGINGFNMFNPADIRQNPVEPIVNILKLTQNGRPLISQNPILGFDEITLRWPNNHFEFEFSALSFVEPTQNQHAYKLHNFDQNWNQIGNQQFGRYTNLPGGEYTLQVIGSNNDGLWNETGDSVRVRVIPPFWETTWFRGLGIAGILLIIFSGIQARTAAIRSRNTELEKQVAERASEIEALFEQTKELAIVAERNRLARDLHDSAKQKAFAALAQLGAAQGSLDRKPDQASRHIDTAENLVQEVLQELTFLIQELHPGDLTEKGLENLIHEYAFNWSDRARIPIQTRLTYTKKLPVAAEQALFRIVQEALANVERHSCAAQVQLTLADHENGLELTISDNGCGFNVHQNMGGFGLRSMEDRAQMAGGQLSIASPPNQGTQIRVIIPTPPTAQRKTI